MSPREEFHRRNSSLVDVVEEESVDELVDQDNISFEDKMVNFISDAIGPKVKNQKVLGLALMGIAGAFLALGNSLVQYIYKKSTKVVMSSFEVLLVRSIIQFIFTGLFMIYGKIHPFGNKKKNLLLLLLMGIVEVAAIIFIYFALEYIPVGDVTVLQFTAPIFTLVFSFLLLRKGCGCFDIVFGAISFVGVLFIAKPDLIIHTTHHLAHMHQRNVNHTAATSVATEFNEHYVKGVSFALLGAMCLSLFFILNKLNGMKLDVTLTVMYPSVVGILVAPIAMAITKQSYALPHLAGEYWGIIIAVGFLCFVGMMFMGEALQLEDAGPAVLIRNCDAIWAFILQYFLIHTSPTYPVLIGTVIVLLCTSMIALNRVFHLQQKWFGNRFDSKCCDGEKEEKQDEEDTHFMLKYANGSEDEEEIFSNNSKE